jgi:membrane dipeptidase
MNTTLPGRYEFGLSDIQEAHAKALHEKAVVIDLLSQRAGANIFAHYPPALQAELQSVIDESEGIYDKYFSACDWPYELALANKSELIFDWYRQAGLSVITHTVPIGQFPISATDPTKYLDHERMRLVTTATEIRQAKTDGVLASYANYQPLGSIPNDLAMINEAYAQGLRSLMLTYNSMTTVGVGCTERVDAGLSRHGVSVVQRCNELGIIVDTSHCGPMTTLDACRFSRAPVTANHSSACGVYHHARGKTDECVRAIADTGGLIGVLAVPAYLTDAKAPTIDHMLDHMEYIANLVGWQHVAIGTDWPLQAPIDIQKPLFMPDNKDTAFRPEDRLDVTVNLAGFDDCRDMPNITRGLVSRGWTDEAIMGVLGENALRVFEVVCG